MKQTHAIPEFYNLELFEISYTGGLYFLNYAGSPVFTPCGKKVCHDSETLLIEMVNDVRPHDPEAHPEGPFTFGFLYALYWCQKDEIESGDDPLEKLLSAGGITDRLFYIRDSLRQTPEIQAIVRWLNEIELDLPNLRPKLPQEIAFDLDRNIYDKKLLINEGIDEEFSIPTPDSRFYSKLKEIYLFLKPEERAFVNQGYIISCDVLFSMAIVMNKCPASYMRVVWDGIYIQHGLQDYYRYVSLYKMGRPIELEEIKLGENKTREFKSTLRFNLHSQKNDDDVIHSCLKTIAAFLNTDGGKLLIGVSDKGEVIGIEDDGFQDNDKYQLHLFNLIKEYLGNHIASLVNTEMIKVGKKFICLVTCERNSEPAYLNYKNRGEEYFIRTGPGTTKLSTSEAHRYIKSKFE